MNEFKKIEIMKTFIIFFYLLFSTLNFYAQKDEKISNTTERKYTINGKSITESDTVKVSKSDLLKNNIDTTETYLVIYDFKKGEYIKGLIKPRVDRPVVYKIININRLAFDVEVNTSDDIVAETDWFSSAEDLKKITGLLNQTNTTSQVKLEEAVKLSDVKVNSESPNTEKTKIENEIKVLKKSDESSIDLLKLENDLTYLLNTKQRFEYYKSLFDNASITVEGTNKTIDELIAEKQAEMEDLQDIIKKNETLKNEKLIEFQNAKKNFDIAYNEFTQSYNKINTIVTYSNEVLPVANQSFLNLKEYTTKYRDKFRKFLIDLILINTTSNSLNTQYTNVVVCYNKLKDIKGLEPYFDKISLTQYYNNVDLIFDNTKKNKFKEELINFEKLSEQVKRIINLLEKEETYEYISAPIQPRNDIATFDVEIKAKNKDVEVNNSRKFKHSEFVRRGTRVDFSIGLASSYFKNTKVYEIYTLDGVNKIGIKSTDLTVPSLIGMISMTNRSSTYLAIGGSAGLGIDTYNGKIQLSNFFIGPTLILGKYDRMMITLGAAVRNVGQLKNGYVLNDTIITQSNDVSSVLYDNYKVGIFVALTYNLTNNVRTKISKYKL